MSPEIYDWEATLHKIVTSKEGDLVGNVDAVDDIHMLVSTEGGRTRYRIPKDAAEGYDGHAVSLRIGKSELASYKDNRAEGFKEVQ